MYDAPFSFSASINSAQSDPGGKAPNPSFVPGSPPSASRLSDSAPGGFFPFSPAFRLPGCALPGVCALAIDPASSPSIGVPLPFSPSPARSLSLSLSPSAGS